MSDMSIPAWPGQEGRPLGEELWRFWAADIRPHFVAEADFLRKYGSEAGYENRYIARVLDDHRLLEELVWSQGEESVRSFAGLLASHIRFKEDYFKERVRKIVETRKTEAGDPALTGDEAPNGAGPC